MTEIYPPSEDSFFLSEFVKKEVSEMKPQKILDMGSGSGVQALAAIKSGAEGKNIVLVDINPLAVAYLKNNFPKSKVVHSNLFENVPGKFDLVIFNPPYLPEDEFDVGLDTSGGRFGSSVVNDFLSQASIYLSKGGKILLLTSSLTQNIKWKKYYKKLLGKKKIFFEELYVWELSLIN